MVHRSQSGRSGLTMRRNLQIAFKRLSTQSIYYRFLQVFAQLTDQQARDFANLDYYQRMALVAETQEAGESNLIGVACYAYPGDESGLAESAVVVIDEYQKRGLGSLLLRRLVRYARSHDVRAFLATVHVSNAQIMRFIKRSGFPAEKKMIEPGVWEIRIRFKMESDRRGRFRGCLLGLAALERFERSADPFSGSTDPRSAGNGSIMRLAPEPMFFARRPEEADVVHSSPSLQKAACVHFAALTAKIWYISFW